MSTKKKPSLRERTTSPLSRFAHKISLLKHDPTRYGVSGSEPQNLPRAAAGENGHPAGTKSPADSQATNGVGVGPLRHGIASDTNMVPRSSTDGGDDYSRGRSSTASPRPSCQKELADESQQQPKRREDEEPEPKTSLDRYGSEPETDSEHPRPLMTVADAVKEPLGTVVTFRARIHTQRRISRFLDFILFRDQEDTIQGVLSRAHPNMVRWVQRLPLESIVQVTGRLQKPVEDVRSALHSDVEVNVDTIYLVSPASTDRLAFSNYRPPDTMHRRLNARVLDLRHPANQALFRVRAAMVRAFRNTLDDMGFMEMQTPKLQPAATETGAAVFKVKYFGRRAFLAQSPQLNKQMAISADFGRVYEIGPVFRAENSNTHRHLTEYTGLDIEMTIDQSYSELIQVVDRVLKTIFQTVQSMPELDIVRQRWPSTNIEYPEETLIFPFAEAIQMLRDDGRDVGEEDLSTRDEIRLGELVKEKFKTDYFILDKFPRNARPFYTLKAEEDPKWTNSFDIFLRGQEICTGGQRINDPKELRSSMRDAGIAEDDMAEYLAAFDLGAPPHGGAGLGLERLVALLLDLGDVRYATLFHRDPKSLPARPPALPHPDADTTKWRRKEGEGGQAAEPAYPPIENLIANYGDASNTSWLDDRFEIWRHHTGAAVGYSRHGKLAVIIGDPLCDRQQYEQVVTAFIDFCVSDLRLTPIWMLVSDDVHEILGRHLGWRTLSCTEEQRLDADRHPGRPSRGHGHGPEWRRVQREGIEMREVRPSDELFRRRADRAIEEWMATRTERGKQVHLTDVRPWVDAAHRRYFAAEKDGRVCALVVLAQLAPRNGWQVKWALDFPGSPNGTIEVLIEEALGAVSGPVTFGVGVSEKLVPGEHMGSARAKFLAKTYDTIVKSLGLARKAEFRQKFGVLGEPVYICYPKHDVSIRELREVVKFFEG